MPKFIKRKTGSGVSSGRRKFVVRSAKKVVVRKTSEPKSVSSQLRHKADSTIDSLNLLLEQDEKSKKHQQFAVDENAVFVDEPDEFNGVSDVDEAKNLYDQALSYERKKAKSVEEQIKALEEEHEKEKRELEAQIRELKRELYRTAPLHDTAFFSLTKELKQAIGELETLMTTMKNTAVVKNESVVREVPLTAEAFVAPAQPPVSVEKKVINPNKEPMETAVPVVESVSGENKEKKGLAKKKVLVTGVSAVVLLFVISGLAGLFLSEPKVDEKIVAQYLPGGGQVQGARTDLDQPTPTPKEIDPSQQDIKFEQAVWEEYKDTAFGIVLQYPKNAVKVIRTDSNVTFIRKTGFLFKVQRIQTTYSVDEYWKQVKSTSLNYSAESEKFKGNVALKLSLEDVTDYPGDRYLVKMGEFIYDIWYATPSNNFTADDIKLADKMLASLSIVNTTE